ncbi:MAG: hypothetical protein AAF958_04645 [Planctomycetota bacterium]
MIPHAGCWNLLGILLAIVPLGCAASRNARVDPHLAYAAGDYATAAEIFAAQNRGFEKDASRLNLAMVRLAAGEVDAATRDLRELREHFDTIASQPPLASPAALTTDDRSIAFRLRDDEKVVLRSLLTLASLAGDGIDAESYSLQAVTQQQRAARDHVSPGDADSTSPGDADVTAPGDPANQVALAPYLRGLLREATHHDYDDAQRAYRLVSRIEPRFEPIQNDLARVQSAVHSPPGHGVLVVISMTGQSPRFREVEAETTTASLAIASSVWSAVIHDQDSDDDDRLPTVLPNIASVKIPEPFFPPNEIQSVGVRIGIDRIAYTHPVTDIGELLIRRYEREKPQMIARAVLRRAAKEAAVAAGAKAINLEGSAASMFQFAAASAWSAAEKADTRSWSLLPREFQVLRMALPVGNHDVRMAAVNASAVELGPAVLDRVAIEDGRDTYRIVVAARDRVEIVRPRTVPR